MADEEEHRFKIENKQISVKITESLGKGGFGVVYKVKDEHHGKYYAMKVIASSDASTEESAKIEQRALGQMHHANIVRIYAATVRPLTRSVTERRILMEFCEGGTLNSKLVEKTSDEVERKWMFQISDAVRYLHDKNIVHRDLKPDNVLLTATLNVKVADFGLAKAFMIDDDGVSASGGPYMKTKVGTNEWMAPEVFRCQYTAKADVFSLGTVLYGIRERTFIEIKGKRYYGTFVEGKTTAEKPAIVALGDAMAHHGVKTAIGNLQFPLNGQESTVSKLILAMLSFKDQERPSAKQVHEVLKMVNLKRNEIQENVPEDTWDQILEIMEDVKAPKRKFQEIVRNLSLPVSVDLANMMYDKYDIDDDFRSKQGDVLTEITNFSRSTLGRSRSIEVKAFGDENKHTNLVPGDFVGTRTLGSSASSASTWMSDNVKENSALQGEMTKTSDISGKGSTAREQREVGRNRISNEVREISLDCNKYSLITENTENESNEQAMNVRNENTISPLAEYLPSGSNRNIPIPGAEKIESVDSNEATNRWMCGDRPSLKMKIALSGKDGRWQIKPRPTARDGNLPSRGFDAGDTDSAPDSDDSVSILQGHC